MKNGNVSVELITVKSMSTLIIIIYLISLATLLGAGVIALLTVRVRRQVTLKHSADMKILADWDRAMNGLYSGNEMDIVIALDKIWALSSPLTYSDIQPRICLFVSHPSENVSMRARKILENQAASLAPPQAEELSTGTAAKAEDVSQNQPATP